MIKRAPRAANYSVIDNRLLDNEFLSWGAKGLLCYLLSKPDNWIISREQLSKASSNGQCSVRGFINELESAGYVKRTRTQTPDGKFHWESTVSEVPEMPGGKPQQDDEPLVGFPPMVFPPMENRPVISTNRTSTEIVKEKHTKRTRTQAADRVARAAEFEAIWAQYPKKGAGKTASLAAALKLSEKDWELAKLTLPEWCSMWLEMSRSDQGKYIPHLTTVFNQRRFETWPNGRVPHSDGTGTALVKDNRFRERVVKNPDGSLSVFKVGRGNAAPIVIPPGEAEAFLRKEDYGEVRVESDGTVPVAGVSVYDIWD